MLPSRGCRMENPAPGAARIAVIYGIPAAEGSATTLRPASIGRYSCAAIPVLARSRSGRRTLAPRRVGEFSMPYSATKTGGPYRTSHVGTRTARGGGDLSLNHVASAATTLLLRGGCAGRLFSSRIGSGRPSHPCVITAQAPRLRSLPACSRKSDPSTPAADAAFARDDASRHSGGNSSTVSVVVTPACAFTPMKYT
jgi:hypothetical protein